MLLKVDTINQSMLPAEGFVKIRPLLKAIPVSRSSWLAGVKAGLYPKPVKLGKRTIVWRVDDIRAFIEQVGRGETK